MKIIYSHSDWNVIDPQNQIVESFSNKQCAKDYLKALEVPYKEFYKVKEHKVMRREDK